MALTPFDMEGVNRDLLAAGNPAKPDMQSILRRNARDLVLGNAILVSSVDAKESVDRFWNDLKTDRGLSVEPRYVELAFGCPPIEWDIDARVRDFAERMGDEYTSLYEQDTTGIKGGDFERFGAFADNHLDFIRALTKARGMDPISSDREIGAFLNTFDKLAAMPEPTPAKQEKDELSAGACDPADPLNLEQSSSYGMTR